MATRANKYASLNFNDIYDKKIGNTGGNKKHSSSSSVSQSHSSVINSTKTALSNSRIHGNMLVLSRPSPKPAPQPSHPHPQPHQPPHHQQNAHPGQILSEHDAISLRPLGKTGSGPSISQVPLTSLKPDKEYSPSPLPSPKQNRVVPPHLRPGFAGREEKPVPEIQKQQGIRSRELGVGSQRSCNFGSPNRFAEDGRPKSGGGYERIRKAGESDLVEIKRPGSSGTRPSSSG